MVIVYFLTVGCSAMENATVELTLADGVAPREPGQIEGRDAELELTLAGGVWQKDAWLYATWFNRADHQGEVVEAQGDATQAKLRVKVRVSPDAWVPPGPGDAQYDLDLRRDGDRYTGSYRGMLRRPDSAGLPVTSILEGAVTGRISPPWHRMRRDFVALAPGEHPRLIFRKHDLPELRRRAETPEGRAIMDRFKAVLDRDLTARGHSKCGSMFPAGHGIAYQLTGEVAFAEQARRLIEPMLGYRGEQDIHFGPFALGLAVTFDLCYDAWPPEFRQQVIDNLLRRTLDLATGTNIGTYAPNPWHNHNGIRAPSCGVAAIALLGEKASDGREIEGLERLIHIVGRDVRRYFTLGLGGSGWCMEGSFYKAMTFNSGPAHFVQAYRSALGGDPIAGLECSYTLLGEWMQSHPGAGFPAFGLGDDQTAGLLPVGMCLVSPPMAAGFRWIFDRTHGLAGDRSFGIQWPFHAAYVLMNYPFAVAAKPSTDSLPWAAPDLRKGRHLFRKPWDGKDDALVTLHLRSEVMPGCHYERSGKTGDCQVFALGRRWIGPERLREDLGAGSSLPLALGNDLMGITTRNFSARDEGIALLSLDLDGAYLAPVEGTRGGTLVQVPRWREGFRDLGIRCRRAMAIDLSGESGAAVLLVFHDRLQRPRKTPNWNLALAEAPRIDGQVFTIGEPSGPNLRGTFLSPAAVRITGGISAMGGNDFLVVITIQNGAAPAVRLEGDPPNQRLIVGGRSLGLDGDDLRFLDGPATVPPAEGARQPVAGAGGAAPTKD